MAVTPGWRVRCRRRPTTKSRRFSVTTSATGATSRREDFELYTRHAARRVIFSFKTEHDLFAVFVGAPIEELPAFQRDTEGAFMSSLDLVPEFAARIRAGRRAERFCGATDLPNFYRKPFGAGWALVGDAGLHKDPLLALGICDALRDTELLANAIADGLSGVRPMHDAMADYECGATKRPPPTTRTTSLRRVFLRRVRRRSACARR